MENTYDFCPKCGALVRNGVCTSCGMDYRNQEESTLENSEQLAEQKVDTESFSEHLENGNAEESMNRQSRGYYDEQNNTSNYYGGQAPAGYVANQKPKSNKIVIGIIVATALVIIVLLCYIGIQITKISRGNLVAEWKNAVEEAMEEAEKESGGNIDSEEDEDFWAEYEKENADEYDKDFTKERENHDASEIEGPYYEEFVNCIDESVSYKVNREFYEKIEPEDGICIQVSYIQLEGDVPNLESINEIIKEESMRYANAYLEDEEVYKERYEENGYNHHIVVESYVTYNDEEMISILLDEKYSISGYTSLLSLYGININLKTGTILDNTEILNADEEFVKEFCRRSNGQNGKNSIAIDEISNEEKKYLLNDNGSLILFYTPIGLEVGYNYSGVEGYTGWITISLQDYEQYLKGY